MSNGNMDVGSSNINSNASDEGDAPKHVCGLCWTSFRSPTELQQHCLECFFEDYSASRESEEEEGPLLSKDKDAEAASVSAAAEIVDDVADCENSPSREDSPSTSSLPDGKTLHLCKLCPKTFTNYGSYRRHLRMHSCGHRYTCDICGKQFFRRYLWIKHYEKIHNSMMQNMCQCTVCEMWLKNSDTLKEHIRTKHRFATGATSDVDLVGDAAAKPPVDTIVLDSLSLQPIKDSVESSPADSGGDAGSAKSLNGAKHQWMCNLCSEVFGTKAQLMKHKEDKHGRKRVWAPKVPTPEVDDTKRVRIEEVAKEVFHGMLSEFSLQGMLSSEAQKAKKEAKAADLATAPAFSPAFPGTGLCDPTKRGVFLCEVCKKTFINRSSYLRHKKMHTGVRPYTCEHCCMSFFRSESLTTHKKKHLSGDQFKCFVCGHIAEGASELSSHFLSSHSKLPEEYDKNTIVRSRRGRPSKYTVLPQLVGQAQLQQTPEEALGCAKKLDQGNEDGDANSEDTVLVGLNGDADSLNSAADKYTCLVCFQFFPDEQSYYDHQCKDDVSAIPNSLEQVKDSSSQDEKEDGAGLTGMPRTVLALETCMLCSAKFPSKKHLQEHMIIHICRYCGRCFRDTCMLVKHIESVHKELVQAQSHTCCCCDLTVEDGTALVEHVLAKHSTMLPSFDISTQSKSSVPNVDSDDKAMEEFSISIKAGTDNQSSEYNKHSYNCGWCKEHFTELHLMITHFRDVHSIINISGEAGGGVYTSDVDQKHLGTAGKQCPKCCQPLVDSPHICIDKSICNLCLRTFDDSHDARLHEELNHVLVDWFCCDVCDACGPRDVMEKHVLSHISKVGNLVVPDTVSEAQHQVDTDAFQKVREAFLNWCRNGTSKNVELKPSSNLSNGELASAPSEKRVKTRSEILIEQAKRGFASTMPVAQVGHGKQYASANGETKHRLSKDIIELLPKNGEITMIPIKSEPTEPFSQLRSALTTARKRSPPATFDRNGNILKKLLGERQFPLSYPDYPWDKQADPAVSTKSASDADDKAVASDPGWYDCEPKGSPASDQGAAGGSSSQVVLKCDDCKRLFTHYSSWRRHRRQHLGLSTHTCSECQRTFYRKDQYDKHLLTHHHRNGAEA